MDSPSAPVTNQRDNIVVAHQPAAKTMMSTTTPPATESPQNDPLRLRGGCPGKFCGLPILPCHCNICIFPIPCC